MSNELLIKIAEFCMQVGPALLRIGREAWTTAALSADDFDAKVKESTEKLNASIKDALDAAMKELKQ